MNYIKELMAYQIEGLIILSNTIDSKTLSELNIPIVSIEREDKYISSVNSDNYAGAFKATNLLIDNKCDILIHINTDVAKEITSYNRIEAFKKACEKAAPVLLEPIMKIEVVTPEESMGDVISDLNKRRGQVEGMESSRSGARIVKANAPLAEMFGYVTALRTITSGRATSTMTFSHYAEVGSSIAKAVLTEAQGRVDLL